MPSERSPSPAAARSGARRRYAIGAACGLVMSLVPLVLFDLYVDGFAATGTPNSGFNVYTLVALPAVLIVVLLAVAALISALVGRARTLAFGYLSGVLAGVLAFTVTVVLT